MADHHPPSKVDNDYAEHESTYELFLALMKWGSVATIIIMLFIGSMTKLLPWALTLFMSVLTLALSTLL